jgi:mannose-6-phosphate isomerase-like protein (cupin superfamily)
MTVQLKKIRSGQFLAADNVQYTYSQRINNKSSNLEFLSMGIFKIKSKMITDEIYRPKEETLLFCLHGSVEVEMEGQKLVLTYYDVLYIPLATPYRIRGKSAEEAIVADFRALAKNKHKPYYASWKKVYADKKRQRKLKGKMVYMMFDITEPADSLVAGYTIYEPFTRAWPTHNHTDQEEIYFFTKGSGSMEVYDAEENKTFVHNVKTMDAVAIPPMNYHPVFSQEEELHFIWCIAGERYWVGDKNKDFMKGKVASLTT